MPMHSESTKITDDAMTVGVREALTRLAYNRSALNAEGKLALLQRIALKVVDICTTAVETLLSLTMMMVILDHAA
jgi:hypothetical protein